MLAGVNAAKRVFVGRERELRLLDRLVTGTSTRGGAAVVRGEAGVGKTALLEQVAAAAPGRVLRVRGVESETELPFVAVADLLLPLRETFDQLPEVQRKALEVSLALQPGPAAGPLAVCAGTLGVLAAAGEREPLLVLVDDFQWVDPSSQQILLFVARRLSAERVVLLLAVREQPGTQPATWHLTTLELAGLSGPECRALVARLHVEVPPGVLGWIVEQTGGNPLAVVETVHANAPERLRGGGVDLAGLVLGPTLRRVWSDVLDDLPESTRVALFVLAASRSSALSDLGPALSDLGPALVELGVSLADLVPAERRGLLRVASRAVELRSPLLRSVVLDRTPLATRLSAYQALARHADAHLRPWYLAASATGPDDAVAGGLVAAAVAAREGSGYRTSARTWFRAAELTVEPHQRAERLLAAAHDAQLAGAADLARAWCTDALELRSDPCFAADVELVRGRAHTALGRSLRAVDDLVRAADGVLDRDPPRAARLYAEATMPCRLAGRISDALALARRSEAAEISGAARSLPRSLPRSLQSLTALTHTLVLAGHVVEARHHLVRTEQATRTAEPPTAAFPTIVSPTIVSPTIVSPTIDSLWDLQSTAALGQLRVWLEEYDTARTLFGDVIETAHRAGVPSILALALGGRSELDWWAGHWASAYADATEALRWAEELDQVAWICYALTALGRLDAARGEIALCRERQDQARHHSCSYGIDSMPVYVSGVLGLAALGAGDLDAAVEHLDQAQIAAQHCGLCSTTVVPFAGDLVEAHIRAGNADRATEELIRLDEQATATSLIYPAAAAARCHGLLAEDADVAAHCFATATALHQRCSMPFEQARTLLCEGETLRRLRRPAAARPPLRHAFTIFDGLGARPWAARAKAELAATGARLTPNRDQERSDLDILTPQELHIARIIADGHNNAEAAAALYISRKTVEAHLTRIYRKLNIRSRTELAHLFAQWPGGPPADRSAPHRPAPRRSRSGRPVQPGQVSRYGRPEM